MDSTQFAYWLQGYLEMSNATTLDEKQVQILKDHLKLVFEKKTPNYNPQTHAAIPGVHEWTTLPFKESHKTYCASTINPNISGSGTYELQFINPDIKCNLTC